MKNLEELRDPRGLGQLDVPPEEFVTLEWVDSLVLTFDAYPTNEILGPGSYGTFRTVGLIRYFKRICFVN
jgi:hypothetical protein